MAPGSDGAVFTGQSESRSLPASRNAMCRSPAFGPSSPARGRGLAVSRAAPAAVPLPAAAVAPALGVAVARAVSRTGVGDESCTVARVAAAAESTMGWRGAESTDAAGTGGAPALETVADFAPSAHAA